MKKMLSLLASISVALCAVSTTASAYNIVEPFPSIEEFYKGVNDGRYLADFDGNGVFDPLDAWVVLEYYSSASTLAPEATIDDIDWNGKTTIFSFCDNFWGGFVENYDTFEWIKGETAISIDLNNEMLENVKKYGDINGDGSIGAHESSYLLRVYYNEFESGDVNADNQVNASDASYVLNYYSSKSTGQAVDSYTEQAMEILADVNGDGKIDANDATEILSTYSELAVSE